MNRSSQHSTKWVDRRIAWMSAWFVSMVGVFAGRPLTAMAAPGRPLDPAEGGDDRRALPQVPAEYTAFESAGIRVAYHPLAHERMRSLLGRLTAIRSELGARLGRPVLSEVEIRVASLPAEMARLSPSPLPPFATSAALVKHHLVIASLGGGPSVETSELEATIRHELAVLALDEATASDDARAAAEAHSKGEVAAAPLIPRWFQEGFAVDFGGEGRASRAEALFLASMRGAVLPLASLESESAAGAPHASLASAEAADFARFLAEPREAPRVAKLAERLRTGEAFDAALADAAGESLPGLEAAWRKDAAKRYGFLPALFAGAVLWLVLAAFVLMRRLRGRAVAKRRARRVTAREARDLRIASRRRATQEPRIEARFKDPEVPKVEHHGRWYTLH